MKLTHSDGTVYDLNAPRITIGRARTNDIVVADSLASGKHAMITIDGSMVILSDVGSTNGTYVNKSRLTAPTRLKGGDDVRIGGTHFTAVADEADDDLFAAPTQMDFGHAPSPAPQPLPPAALAPPSISPPPDRPAAPPPVMSPPEFSPPPVMPLPEMSPAEAMSTPPAMTTPPPPPLVMPPPEVKPLPAMPAPPQTHASVPTRAAPPRPARRNGVRWLVGGGLAVFLIGVVIVLGRDQIIRSQQASATQSALTSMLSDLAGACSRRGGSRFAAYSNSPGIHPIILISAYDASVHIWNSRLPDDWKDDDWTHFQLVGCVAAKTETIETCRYDLGLATLYREQQQATVTLVSARTGDTVNEHRFWGSEPERCLQIETFKGSSPSKTKSGSEVDFGEVQSWLTAYVAP